MPTEAQKIYNSGRFDVSILLCEDYRVGVPAITLDGRKFRYSTVFVFVDKSWIGFLAESNIHDWGEHNGTSVAGCKLLKRVEYSVVNHTTGTNQWLETFLNIEDDTDIERELLEKYGTDHDVEITNYVVTDLAT